MSDSTPKPASKLSKVCPICRQTFFVYRSRFNIRTYCSRTCMAAAYSTKWLGSSNPKSSGSVVKPRPEPKPPKPSTKRSATCPVCGKSFQFFPSKVRQHCSQACADVTIQANRPQIHCPICGRSVRVSPARIRYRQQATCSKECSRTFKSLRQQGEKSHRWQGGKTEAAKLRRNSAEYRQWRRTVFERDDYTCVLCNKRGHKLAAHHIRTVVSCPESIYDPSNGVSLCWPCHQSIKSREHEYEEMFLQHTKA